MIHSLLLIVAVYLVILGVVSCAFLIAVTIKGWRGMWLITLPAIFIVTVLGIDFVCHVMHLSRQVIPYQKQVVKAIHWTLDAALIPALLIKLRELWLKKQMRAVLGETR